MKAQIKSFLILVACVTMLTSCYSVKNVSLQSEYEHACKGLTKSEVIILLGEPVRETVIDGVPALVYESFVEPEQGTKQNSIQYAGQWMESRRHLEVYFDGEGRCNRVETNLTKETRFKDEKKTTRVVWSSVAGASVAAALGTVLAIVLPRYVRK